MVAKFKDANIKAMANTTITTTTANIEFETAVEVATVEISSIEDLIKIAMAKSKNCYCFSSFGLLKVVIMAKEEEVSMVTNMMN